MDEFGLVLAQEHKELDILRSSLSRRETSGIGSEHARQIKPRKCVFCCVSAAILWMEPQIKYTCPLISYSPSHCSL